MELQEMSISQCMGSKLFKIIKKKPVRIQLPFQNSFFQHQEVLFLKIFSHQMQKQKQKNQVHLNGSNQAK